MTIQYSTDGGSAWQNIVMSTLDDGLYDWTVPNTPSTNCLVKVCDMVDPTCCDQSNSSFTICEPVQPDFSGTPTSSEGQTCNVQFTDQSSGCVTDWSWDFGDGGTSTQQSPSHTYDCGSTFTVSLTASGPCGTDIETKHDFITCACPCQIILTSPNGGETWCVGQSENITWNSQNTGGQVKIEHSTDGGASWHIVKAITPDDGNHPWTIPEASSTECLIRICDTADPDCCDTSEGPFQLCECGTIEITTDSLANGSEGSPYDETVQATGGCQPYLWSVVSGQLPEGLKLVRATGNISGTPACVETCYFRLEVEDLLGTTDRREYCLIIEEFVGLRGDVNRDMAIDILDVLMVINHILDDIPITDYSDLRRADCNADHVVDILDALAIVNVFLGYGQCAPGACKPMVLPETMKTLESLKSYLSPGDFSRLMALVKEVQLPTNYTLSQNYPNPFNPTTTIHYTIPSIEQRAQSKENTALYALRTTLKIYNLLGQEVRTLVDEAQEPGYYTVIWDGKDKNGRGAASGVYLYRLSVENFTATKRMVLMK